MSNKLAVTINSTPVEIKEYQGQRVVTLKEIDQVHQRPDGTARRNFNTNKEHLIDGVDYFVRNSSEATREFGLTAPNGLTILTESGYLMLVKSFTDDLAWTVQRQLVNTYFRVAKKEAKPKPIPLSSVNNAARMIMKAYEEANVDPAFKVLALKEIYEPFGVAVPTQGLPPADKLYDKTAIAKAVGMVSTRSGKPHSQAIGAVISCINVQESEMKMVPYMNNGHPGTTVQYTEAVLERVRAWLDNSDYPCSIRSGDGTSYKVAYTG